jgi:predicted NBD/HSP70 family sugar kinase/biotin operon repressor
LSTPQDGALASLDLLRQITDRHVVDQLLSAPTLTRAEIAARTGISKPTISESIRRLEASGLVCEAGQQQGRRGRAGTYYSLRTDFGYALAVSAGPEGIVAETRDVWGRLLRRLDRDTQSPVAAAELNPLLLRIVRDATAGGPGRLLGSALSVAGPVDRLTGRLVHLPNSPFLVDELDPRSLLGEVLGHRLQIDNDVNWAALAEAREGGATDLDDFFFCHLGHGLGGAIVRGGELVRGYGGLAGEVAHVLTTGPNGRSMRLVECFAGWDLLQKDSPAIDVDRVRAVLDGGTAAERRTRDAIVDAVAGALASVVAVLNPEGIVVGGPWGQTRDFRERLAMRLSDLAVLDVRALAATFGAEGPFVGARLAAVRSMQESLTAADSSRGPAQG